MTYFEQLDLVEKLEEYELKSAIGVIRSQPAGMEKLNPKIAELSA